jgi:hypothetical protein
MKSENQIQRCEIEAYLDTCREDIVDAYIEMERENDLLDIDDSGNLVRPDDFDLDKENDLLGKFLDDHPYDLGTVIGYTVSQGTLEYDEAKDRFVEAQAETIDDEFKTLDEAKEFFESIRKDFQSDYKNIFRTESHGASAGIYVSLTSEDESGEISTEDYAKYTVLDYGKDTLQDFDARELAHRGRIACW